MRKWVASLGASLLVPAVIGCGGGSGGITSIAGNKKLMALSSDESTQLCTDAATYIAHHLSRANVCKYLAVTAALAALAIDPAQTDAQLQSACTTAAASCDSRPQPAGSCSLGDTSTCAATATVDDVSRCAVDDAAATNTALAAVPDCAAVTRDWLDANGSTVGVAVTPASCATLATECPELQLPM